MKPDIRSILLIIIFLFCESSLHYSSGQINQLKEDLKKASTIKEKINALTELTVEYCNFNIDSAQFFSDSLTRFSYQNKSNGYISRAEAVQAYVYEKTGNFDLAIEHQLQALKYSKKTNDRLLIATNYTGAGVMYDFMGEYEKALEYYFKGYKIRSEENDSVGMQQSLSNIGLVYHLKGDFNNALNYLYRSRDLAEKLKSTPGYSSSLINIALVFQQQGDLKKALELNEKALEIFLKQNATYDIALVYNNLGSIYHGLKEYEKSIFYHKKSLKLKAKIKDLQGKVMSLQNIGLIYFDKKNLDSALIYLGQAEKLLDSINDPVGRMEVDNTMGLVYYHKNDNRKAEKYFKEAIDIYNSGIDYYKIYQTYRNYASLKAKNGDYQNAYYYNNLSWEMEDSIRNNENTKNIQQKELEAEYVVKRREDELKRKLEQEALAKQQKIEKEAEEKQQRIWKVVYISVFSALMTVLLFIYRNYRQKKKANNLLTERNSIISLQNSEIRKQTELLKEKNRDITSSIQYAKRLQDAILPTENELRIVLKDYFVLYQPKDIVSGDFYWMHQVSENKYLFAVVDCTGHGVPGGFVSIVGSNALNRAVNEFNLVRPDEILNKVSELVEDSFETEITEIRDGMDMSLIAVDYSGPGIKVEYAGANNPLWFITNGTLHEIKADKQPIGKYEGRKPFTLHASEMKKGDRLVLFSDGYADQFGGSSGKKFKYAQLKDKLMALQHLTMPQQKENLEKIINNWRGDLEQVDDICIVGIYL